MSVLSGVDRWCNRHAQVLLGVALFFLAILTLTLYADQIQTRMETQEQSSRIAALELQSDSLAKALDTQREASKDAGAEVVAPSSEIIKQNPEIVQYMTDCAGQSVSTLYMCRQDGVIEDEATVTAILQEFSQETQIPEPEPSPGKSPSPSQAAILSGATDRKMLNP